MREAFSGERAAGQRGNPQASGEQTAGNKHCSAQRAATVGMEMNDSRRKREAEAKRLRLGTKQTWDCGAPLRICVATSRHADEGRSPAEQQEAGGTDGTAQRVCGPTRRQVADGGSNGWQGNGAANAPTLRRLLRQGAGKLERAAMEGLERKARGKAEGHKG
ncbi:hypothetical protein ERJ75_001399500 [Trypanosoma vivax]|nr:hypothetical protein ERJ75_001399500 [Trypanosoma vivax]